MGLWVPPVCLAIFQGFTIVGLLSFTKTACVTILTGARGRRVDLVWHMWKEALLLSKDFEIPGVSMPNFVLFFFYPCIL